MRFAEVQLSINDNLDKIVETSRDEVVRHLAEEVKQDLESTEVTTCYAKFRVRGRRLNYLERYCARLERENSILTKRLEAVARLTAAPLNLP